MHREGLYIGNLPVTVTPAMIFDHFALFSPASVTIVIGRAFGYVAIKPELVERARKALNGSIMGGSTLVVQRPGSENEWSL